MEAASVTEICQRQLWNGGEERENKFRIKIKIKINSSFKKPISKETKEDRTENDSEQKNRIIKSELETGKVWATV